MRRLITIDLLRSDLDQFEDYESRILPLVEKHGGRVEMRVRAADVSE